MRYLFVGPLNLGEIPTGGEQYKNRLLLRLIEDIAIVTVIDTFQWKRKITLLPKLLRQLIIYEFDRIIISTSAGSAYRFIRFFRLLGLPKHRLFYFVIGGSMPDFVAQSKYTKVVFEGLGGIVVEGIRMKETLIQFGIQQVHVIPNFKKRISYLRKNLDERNVHHFVFFSRVIPEKGVLVIHEAVKILLNRGLGERFDVTLFGPLGMDIQLLISGELSNYIRYKGYLDLLNDQQGSYSTLSCYHTMLFPTYWPSEGFPGVLVDAAMLELPVIATDWNMNSELINHELNGLIIPPQNADSLAEAMIRCILDNELWLKMRKNAGEYAARYDMGQIAPNIHALLLN